MLEPDGTARRNRGGPESSGADADVEDDDADEEDEEGELTGVICAGVLPSESAELARRMRGRSLSSLLEELLLDELLLEALEELLATVLLSELEVARRSRGRSGSLSFDELPEELLPLSSELDAARRNLGRLLSDELFEALLEEESPEEPSPRGREVSSVASEAAECSSGVPSFTIFIFTAW